MWGKFEPIKKGKDETKDGGKFIITEAQATKMLNGVIEKWETGLSGALGAHDLPPSVERAALISLLYNTTGGTAVGIKKFAPGMIGALQRDPVTKTDEVLQRADAWYEIVYGSNKNQENGNQKGLQNRRDDEGKLFRLYSKEDGTPSHAEGELEAKTVIRYLDVKKGSDVGLKEYYTQRDISEPEAEQRVNLQYEPARKALIDRYYEAGRADVKVTVDAKDHSGKINLEQFGQDVSGQRNLVFGEEGNDVIKSGRSDDVLFGGDGKDILHGNAGDDTLRGDAGNDHLEGGDGADIYLVGKGSGQDEIRNHDADGRGINEDTLLFDKGITAADISFIRSSDGSGDLTLSIKGTTDSVVIQGYLNQMGGAVENITFADGTVWREYDVLAKVNLPTANDDVFLGSAENDVLRGGNGSDMLAGYEGNDRLKGQAGDDELYGEKGMDTLNGGAGNDRLSGGNGADIYLFGKGSGWDRLDENNPDASADTLRFGKGIAPSDIELSRSFFDKHLTLSIKGTTDSVTIYDYFYVTPEGALPFLVENIAFADGHVWHYDDVNVMVRA